MRSNQVLPYLLIFFFGISNLHSQTQKEIIAKAGDIVITKDEFHKRYEFIPHITDKEGFDSTSFKKNFLYTLIAEKLLAQAANKEGVDKSQSLNATLENLSNVYLRDALYKKEVLDKIIIPDSAIILGQFRMMRSVRTKFIFSQDEKEIEKIYSDINFGASFDSILITRQERKEQKEAAEVTFGTMNEKMEDAIYKVGIGQITTPIELKEGWYICKIYSVTLKTDLNESEKSKVEKIVKSRIEDKIYQDFYMRFFKGIIVNTDRAITEKLFNVLFSYLNENKKNLSKDKGGKYRIGEYDLPNLKKAFSEKELNQAIIKFEKEPVKLSKLFDYLSFQDFEFFSFDSTHIISRLNSYISFYIKSELLVREAKKRKYENLPEVASELKMWKDYYLSHEMMKRIFKDQTVTDDEAYKFFVKANQVIQQPDEFNISEISTHELSNIELALNELNKGADFKELAKKYSSSDSLRLRGGESGFFKESEKGEIGKAAAHLKIGEVIGPIKTPNGYSLIKLLDKKEGKKEKIATFDEANEDIKNILRTEKMYKMLDDKTIKSASEYGVEINNAALNSVKVSTTNMIVLRRFGFGGQLLAVPYTPNYSSWFKKYERLKKKNLP